MAVANSIKKIWKLMIEEKIGFEQILKKVTLTKCADGVCTAEMTVDQEHTNLVGNLHGGLTCTLVDTISGLALRTMTKDGKAGVSVDLHVTFIKAVSLGERIVVEARTNRCGKNFAFLQVHFTNKETGDIVAKGSHTKYLLPTLSSSNQHS